jgi:GDPmannose 4,6-dehydratase
MRALITGINGQDGSYLAELLLGKGYEVHGTVRRASHPNMARLEGFRDRVSLHWADLSDASALCRVVLESQPDEVYNLGAMSDVRVSFDTPEYAGDVTGLGCTRMLELVRQLRPQARFYQAGSSEMFGMNPDVPTDESSEFRPASPYAAAKVYAHHVATNYRDAYGMFVATGILFNHESPRRGVEFVTRKITRAVADIAAGRAETIQLGSMSSRRDWGHAKDYVRAMWLMLQADRPGDFVVATGESYSVLQFLQEACDVAGVDWRGRVDTDPGMMRPTDPPVLLGDASKARLELGWEPTYDFRALVREMVEHDMEEAS